MEALVLRYQRTIYKGLDWANAKYSTSNLKPTPKEFEPETEVPMKVHPLFKPATQEAVARVVATGAANATAAFALRFGTDVVFNCRRFWRSPGFVVCGAASAAREALLVGISTSAIDEVLLKYRGAKHTKSNTVLSGGIAGALEARKEGLGRMLLSSGRSAATAWLLFSVWGVDQACG